MKFRKKPVVIEAIKWTGGNKTELLKWMRQLNATDAKASELTIKTLEGGLHASIGDWIIRGVKGEFYPCKPDIFEQTYELVED